MLRNITLAALFASLIIPQYAFAEIATDLEEGSEGDTVLELQNVLLMMGHYYLPVPTGFYGDRSYDAVINFQQANDIKMTGYFGEQTRAKFNERLQSLGAKAKGSVLGASTSTGTSTGVFTRVMMRGDKGDDVAKLQTFLRVSGLFDREPTGEYGPVTAKAVSAFQKANDLRPTGNINEKTLPVLNKKATMPLRAPVGNVTTTVSVTVQ